MFRKALSTLSPKSATVAENGETTATVAEFGDNRTFLRQCGQALTIPSKTPSSAKASRISTIIIRLQCKYNNCDNDNPEGYFRSDSRNQTE